MAPRALFLFHALPADCPQRLHSVLTVEGGVCGVQLGAGDLVWYRGGGSKPFPLRQTLDLTPLAGQLEPHISPECPRCPGPLLSLLWGTQFELGSSGPSFWHWGSPPSSPAPPGFDPQAWAGRGQAGTSLVSGDRGSLGSGCCSAPQKEKERLQPAQAKKRIKNVTISENNVVTFGRGLTGPHTLPSTFPICCYPSWLPNKAGQASQPLVTLTPHPPPSPRLCRWGRLEEPISSSGPLHPASDAPTPPLN